MTNYDKRKCIRNIKTLAEDNGLKLGDLEKMAGREPGHLSRLGKEGNKTDLTVGFVSSAADQLGVSMDYLIREDASASTPADLYKMRFIEKLKNDTLSGEISWKCERQVTLQDMLGYNKYENLHPMFDAAPQTSPRHYEKITFDSNTFGRNCSINDDCYSTWLRGKSLYIMNINNQDVDDDTDDNSQGEVHKSEMKEAIELWAYEATGFNKKSYLCGTEDSGGVGEAVKGLCMAIKDSLKHPAWNDGIMKYVESYLNGEEYDPFADIDDDVPF